MISATVVADSVNPDGDRLTSLVCEVPKWLLAEINTHRVLSKSWASSRAIPTKRMLRKVRETPYVPRTWYANGAGMQARELLPEDDAVSATSLWQNAMDEALYHAEVLDGLGAHKSYVNRLLEPFAYVKGIVSGTDWANFAGLRAHEAAMPEFQELAEAIMRARLTSEPTELTWGQWHVPFGDRMEEFATVLTPYGRRRVAVARCARSSYETFDGAIDPEKDLGLEQRLRQEGHWGPFEHVAQAKPGRHANFQGFWQFRHQIPGGKGRAWDQVKPELIDWRDGSWAQEARP